MSFLKAALELAAQGFHVFPLIPGGKLPAIENFPEVASRDPEQIRRWWVDPVLEMEQPFNVGISTTRFGSAEALLVVDVDNKKGKKGDDEILRLELEGKEFPLTFSQFTPTTGRHLVYRVPAPVKQGADVLGKGLDVRSRGGYIVGAGSDIDGRSYTVSHSGEPAPAPAWILAACGGSAERKAKRGKKVKGVDAKQAQARAKEYLERTAPVAIEGDAGDQTTYQVACRVKDFGVEAEDCFNLMAELWNPRCLPPWDLDELLPKVENAYRYGKDAIGAASPEADFADADIELDEKTEHPFTTLNKNFAFITAGGGHHILWETTDPDGRYKLEHLNEASFHKKFASRTMTMGDGKTKPITELWMRSNERRSYKGMCFRPGLDAPKDWYNLWRGFAVEPLPKGEMPTYEMQVAVDQFLDHSLKNVCGGLEELHRWLIGYFAHMVQRPWEKPLVALVFRGAKGVGKNALVERVGYLLGSHFLLSSNRRYLIGNFNGHLENLLMLAFDEAFWSGDKQAEGTLKDLITGKTHVIEHKGKEPYSVENCTRVCIIGNEEWLVPASQDERRFAVFDVGEGRKQDRAFFTSMRKGMEQGGYRLLLRYLMEFKLDGIDVNAAPNTAALLDQKVKSLDPLRRWWLECLSEGRIVSSEFGGEWAQEVEKERFRAAFRRYLKENNIPVRIPEERSFGKAMKACCPSIDGSHKKRIEGAAVNLYRLPDLGVARREWEEFIGHKVSWE